MLSAEEIQHLKVLLTKLRASSEKVTNYGYSFNLQSYEYHILLVPKTKKSFSEYGERQKRRRKALLRSVASLMNMEKRDASLSFATIPEIKSFVSTPQLSTEEILSILTTRKYTERDLLLLRNYNINIPPIYKLRQARWSQLEGTPPIQLLEYHNPSWRTMPAGRVQIKSQTGRNIEAVRFNVSQFITTRLKQYIELDENMKFLGLKCIPIQKRHNTVPCLFSLDSGTGSVKFMGKILFEDCSQKLEEVMLLGQACGSDESFQSIERCFGEIAKEISTLVKDGINIGPKKFKFFPIYVADFKVYYSLTGNLGQNSTYPCPWCGIKGMHLDCDKSDILQKYNALDMGMLPTRPDIMDLKNAENDNGKYQRKGTYNLFSLTSGLGSNMIPPPLHIKLGIVNKFIEVLDEVTVVWQKKKFWVKQKNQLSPIATHLINSLKHVRTRRENYHSGDLPGACCTNFMSKMPEFCHHYFGTSLPDGSLIEDSIPNIMNLKHGLLRIALIYNGNEEQNGINYYLGSSMKWDNITAQSFESVIEMYTAEIKRSFWRPRKKHNHIDEVEEPWRKPFLMPKYHALIAHVKNIAMYYGYYGIFSEECFENMQRESKRLRYQHSMNKSIGVQLADNLQYSAVSSSPKSISLRKSAEKLCLEHGKVLKKARFTAPDISD